MSHLQSLSRNNAFESILPDILSQQNTKKELVVNTIFHFQEYDGEQMVFRGSMWSERQRAMKPQSSPSSPTKQCRKPHSEKEKVFK